MHVVCWNARGSNHNDVHFQASMGAIEHNFPGWHAAFICEFDFVQQEAVLTEFLVFFVLRFWGGPGCRSFAWVFKSQPTVLFTDRTPRFFALTCFFTVGSYGWLASTLRTPILTFSLAFLT